MPTPSRFLRLAFASFALWTCSQVQARIIALDWSSGGGSNTTSFTRGWSFTSANEIEVTALGWYDANQDGLTDAHEVRIWDLSQNSIMSATVRSGTSDPLTGKFRYNSTISGNSRLQAGSYIIGGLSTTNDGSFRAIPVANLLMGAGITFGENKNNGRANVLSYPSVKQSGLDAGYFGPNFMFQEVTAVPTPATLHLVGLALGALVFAGYRQRHSQRQQRV
jgi:hypothetical protein